MAIAYDAFSSGSGTGSTLTVSHTTTGSNVGLAAGVFLTDSSSRTITSVTYNGVAMTEQYQYINATNRRIGLFTLAVGAGVGAKNIIVTLSGAVSNGVALLATSYSGVAQTGTVDNKTKQDNSGTPSPLTATLTTVADNCWLIGMAATARANSAGTSTTKRGGIANFDEYGAYDTNAAKTPAGSVSVQATMSPNDFYGSMMAVSFAPYVAAAASTYPALELAGN